MPSVAEIAAALGAEFAGDGGLLVAGPAEPAEAGPDELALAMDKRFAASLGEGKARAALLWPGADWQALGLEAAIFVPRARLALAGVGEMFATPLAIPAGIHPSAVIDETAQIGPDCDIGPFTVIGPGAQIGAGCRIASHGAIGAGAVIGEGALLHPHVTIGAHVIIGARFIAGAGAVVGGDGFAFVTGEMGAVEEAKATGTLTLGRDSHHKRINSLGTVIIGDDVEIGCNTTIDRGTISETRIGSGTKVDNQVQIGHNVKLGRDCLMAGQSGVAGSTEIGDRVVIGGATAVADHLRIGSDVVIAGGSGVSSHVAPGKVMMGNPAVEMKQNIEIYKALRRLPRLMTQLRKAEKPVSKD